MNATCQFQTRARMSRAAESTMITLQIDGMTCNHCVRAVTQAVQSVKSDASVDIDLDAGTAKIATGKDLDAPPIVAAIEEEGYKVKSVQAA